MLKLIPLESQDEILSALKSVIKLCWILMKAEFHEHKLFESKRKKA